MSIKILYKETKRPIKRITLERSGWRFQPTPGCAGGDTLWDLLGSSNFIIFSATKPTIEEIRDACNVILENGNE